MTTTILLVDDNRTVRIFCKEELEKRGFRVAVAHNGCQASEILRALVVDVIVLDVHLPQQSGFELAKEYRKKYPQIPIIFHSTNSRFAGTENWVTKSADVDPLVAAILRLANAQCNLK